MFIPYTIDGNFGSRLQNEYDKLTSVMRMPQMRYVERPGRTIADYLVIPQNGIITNQDDPGEKPSSGVIILVMHREEEMKVSLG